MMRRNYTTKLLKSTRKTENEREKQKFIAETTPSIKPTPTNKIHCTTCKEAEGACKCKIGREILKNQIVKTKGSKDEKKKGRESILTEGERDREKKCSGKRRDQN